ncbi:hypothetical protein AB0D67_30785 [Streptosporangium sp. NPDC048047]|uniref:hypothetical protein n=1 Tax=Streptosporangium sp. NPDC048047 TaxID=3155748 RepID=UPI00342C209E
MTRVIQRIGARVIPAASIGISPLDVGGVRVRVHQDDQADWLATHTLLRELRLVGWEVSTDRAGLLVLGWSAANLTHRIQTLRISVGGLSDCVRTVATAVAAAESYLAAFPAASMEEVLTAVVEEVEAAHLRWPARARELADLERASADPLVGMLLRHSVTLEQQVLELCGRHVTSAAAAVTALYDAHARQLSPDGARHLALRNVGASAAASDTAELGRAS